MATLSLFTGSIASANDTATATPAPGNISGYVNQGTPVVQTTATQPANAVVVTAVGATPPAGYEDAGSWPQGYDSQPFSVAPVGEAGQDGWSWTNWNYLVVTLTQTVQNVVVLWDNWNDNSQDGYGSFSGNAGDTFIVNAAGGDGVSQVDFFWMTATPTPTEPPATGTPTPTPCAPKTPCTPKVITLPPQTVDCIVPLAAAVDSITYNGKAVGYRQGGWDNVQFTNGDLMNGLYANYQNAGSKWTEESVVIVTLKNGEVILLQPTPNVDHGYSKGCFIAHSSTWGEGYTPAAGRPVFSQTSSDPIVIPCPPTEVANTDEQ